eukprot:TRINITY_DN388_c0_g1_i2.p1 TRINITY_DN388_c0_g1~~TRINITY_DN388_c0_g1_i2.p1  ORF type:complete len:291 (+),score=110.58 TRINITY_DN388_c0_g1_i2:138-1010(+)
MSSSVEEFVELLEGNETEVDLVKLADRAQHGVPSKVRGAVWAHLLGTVSADKSNEASVSRAQLAEYQALDKSDAALERKATLCLERLARQKRNGQNRAGLALKEDVQRKLINVLLAFSSHRRDTAYEFKVAHLHMLAHIAVCVSDEAAIFALFVKLQQLVAVHFGPTRIDKQVARLMGLLRQLMPELHAHFDEEEVPPNWAVPWLRHLLASQLPTKLVLRLWDVYFSCDDGLDLHVFVCLAILREISDSLLEQDGEAIEQTLARLPRIDIGQIVAQAYNLRRDALNNGQV